MSFTKPVVCETSDVIQNKLTQLDSQPGCWAAKKLYKATITKCFKLAGFNQIFKDRKYLLWIGTDVALGRMSVFVLLTHSQHLSSGTAKVFLWVVFWPTVINHTGGRDNPGKHLKNKTSSTGPGTKQPPCTYEARTARWRDDTIDMSCHFDWPVNLFQELEWEERMEYIHQSEERMR